jgi:peptidoglycan-associated lipoprotein
VTQVQADPASGDVAGPAGVGRVIYFDFDSFTVRSEYQPLVDQHARFLQSNRGRSVAVEGHTDERGSREYNLALGQKRAEAVRRALTLVGATDAQVEAVSFGEEKPAVAGASEDAYSQNRRVEIRYR